MDLDPSVRNYMAMIGRRGGRISKRPLNRDTAQTMVRIREARRAFRKFHTQCFWSYSPDLEIHAEDIPWVAEQLKKHGNLEAWRMAAKLCR